MEIETWKNGANICIDNVNHLIEDGKLLIENKSYGHACFSFITALEEMGIAYFILGNFFSPKPKEFKKFLTHKKKMVISNIINLVTTGEPIGITKKLNLMLSSSDFEVKTKKEKMDEVFKLSNEIQKKENLWFLRNAGIYVGLDSSKKDFIHPGQIGQGYAVNLHKKARDASIILQIERDKLFKFGKTLEKDSVPITDILKASIMFDEVSSSFFDGSIEEIRDISGVSSSLKDFLTKVLLGSFPIVHHELNLEINDPLSLEEFDKVMLIVLYEAFKVPILRIKDIDSDKKLKEILEFSIKRWIFYSPQSGKLVSSILELFKTLGSGNVEASLQSMGEFSKLIEKVDEE